MTIGPSKLFTAGFAVLLSILWAPAVGAETPPEARIYSGERPDAKRSDTPSLVLPQTTVEEGLICTTIDFEGVGDLSAIPVFDGITSPDWLGIIDADAGGSGNIAFEPSPETIAFWLGGEDGTGSSRDILFDEPAAVVEFFYASAVTTRLEAFDSSGRLLESVTGPANFDRGPGGDPTGNYNQWDPLRLQWPENEIARVRVSGAVNQTGIDNLKVCRRSGVDTVEFTQAIQRLQDLDDLEADLADDGEPPVPMVLDKPAVMRVYFRKVQAVTRIEVEAEIDGVTRTRMVTLQPGCSRDDMRLQRNGCRSGDFYFTPSSDEVTVELTLTGDEGLLEEHRFELQPREAEPIVLAAVRVCDSRDARGDWLCADDYYRRLATLATLLRKIAPTASVRVLDSGETVRREIDADGDGVVTTGTLNVVDEDEQWWMDAADEIDDLHGIFDGIRDLVGLEDRRYYGMARPGLAGGILGIAAGIPSRGALSRTSARDLGSDVSQDTVAHETFHTMDRPHTGTAVPRRTTAPGCHLASALNTDWPYPDNRTRSGNRASNKLEVGFDVARGRAMDPQNTFDIMSYCVPVWISTFTYTRVLEDALATPFAGKAEPRATSEGDFWLVSGSIEDGGGVTFDPLFELPTAGSTEEGSGTHRLEVRNGSSGVLYTRRFTPAAAQARTQSGADPFSGTANFSELIPVQDGAASVVILDAGGSPLGSVPLSGTSPSVTISSPAGGESWEGVRQIVWQVTDPDSNGHRSWVQYSPDGGALGTWQTLGFVEGNTLRADFDGLPGSDGDGLIRVLASDGVNASAAVSAPFSVPAKEPIAEIIAPEDGSVYQESATVWLQGLGFDQDEGTLEQLTWRSNRDAVLGTGPSLPVSDLSPGTHTITLEARASDGGRATDTVTVSVAGAGPSVDLEVEFLDSLPTTCVEAGIDARAGSVPLETVEVSLNGGRSWTGIPLSSLPLRAIVPGKGFFHMVVRAFDVAGQVAAEDIRFFTEEVCESGTPPPPAGTWLTTGALPDFRFKARITSDGSSVTGSSESGCIGETLCISGRLPGRAELFTRIIGPRPNGRLWVNLVRFSPSEVELWVEQRSTGQINYYRLPAVARESSVLSGLVDKEAFFPSSAASSPWPLARSRAPGDPGVSTTRYARVEAAAAEPGELSPRGAGFGSPEFPGYRFHVRILRGDQEADVRRETDCLSETVCVSGALPGRSELFLRLIGPRPNGFLWVNLVRFTTSRVEVEILQLRTGETRRYVLPAIPRESDELNGLVDKEAFSP